MKTLRSLMPMFVFWWLAAGNAFGQATPTDVYRRALEVAAEVDLIRLEMGVADQAVPDIAVSGVQPREVYFQALTLHKKSNRLLFEQLRERVDAPPSIPPDVTPDAVLNVVDNSLALVSRVKESFGITEATTIEELNDTKTPTDVYKLIIRINRALNSLLHERFAPAEVYQQLTYGVGLSSSILATVASGERLGIEPPFARRKTPVDVYRRLIAIYAIVHETMKLSGDQCLVIEPDESEREYVNPSDVYDLASLLVSELSYLHSLTPGASAPKDSYYPGDKLPAHAYQRAGRLESQVTTLRNYVAMHPAWLDHQ